MSRATNETPRLSASEEQELAFAKRAARWVGVYSPLVLTLIAVVLTVVWLPRMPDPAATQWGFSGGPGSFGPAWTNIALSAGLGLGMVALFAVVPFFEALKPGTPVWGWSRRFIATMSLASITLIQLTSVITAWVQLDLEDAADAPPIGWAMLVSSGVAAVAGVIGWFAQPKLNLAGPELRGAEPAPLPRQAKTVWLGEARPGKSFVWFTVPALALILVFPVIELSRPNPDWLFVWIMCGTLLLVAVVLLANLWFRVRVDKNGLEARGPLGWPVYRVAADDIKSVKVVQVQPFSEFGGWGARFVPDRFGIVMRAGEGLVIERHSQARTFTITVDDAEGAASLLASLSAKRH